MLKEKAMLVELVESHPSISTTLPVFNTRGTPKFKKVCLVNMSCKKYLI
jgi:hypothetical protein